jgi:hypothetical protein
LLVTQAVLSEPNLLRALFDVGYFVPSTAPADDCRKIAAQSSPVADEVIE